MCSRNKQNIYWTNEKWWNVCSSLHFVSFHFVLRSSSSHFSLELLARRHSALVHCMRYLFYAYYVVLWFSFWPIANSFCQQSGFVWTIGKTVSLIRQQPSLKSSFEVSGIWTWKMSNTFVIAKKTIGFWSHTRHTYTHTHYRKSENQMIIYEDAEIESMRRVYSPI